MSAPRTTAVPRKAPSRSSRQQVASRQVEERPSYSAPSSSSASSRSGRSVADFLPALSKRKVAEQPPSRRASSSQGSRHFVGSVRATPIPTAPRGGYSVQLGSFSSENNALGVRDRMAILTFGSARMPASSTPVDVRGRTYHRVRLGPFNTRWEANKAASIAEEHGLSGKLVKH